jgi:hypothetical protein
MSGTATVAYSGRGSKLNLQTASSPATYTEVGQLKKFSFGGIKVTLDDITNLDSPSAFKEVLPTILDPGDVTFDGVLNNLNVSQQDMLNICQAMTLSNFQITLSDGVTTISFAGYVTEWVPVTVEVNKANAFSGKISITGPVTVVS